MHFLRKFCFFLKKNYKLPLKNTFSSPNQKGFSLILSLFHASFQKKISSPNQRISFILQIFLQCPVQFLEMFQEKFRNFYNSNNIFLSKPKDFILVCKIDMNCSGKLLDCSRKQKHFY